MYDQFFNLKFLCSMYIYTMSKYNASYYFTNWGIYARNYHVKDIPIEQVPELMYAFLNVKPNAEGYYIPFLSDPWSDIDKRYTSGGVEPQDSWNDPPGKFYGSFGQFKKLQDQGYKFDLGLSAFGWSWSQNASDCFKSPPAREAFAQEMLNICNKYPIFNKINIDWEYISPAGKNYGLQGNVVRAEDPENFIEFLKLMRQKLNADGKEEYKISAAVTGAPDKMDALPVEQMAIYLDEFHIMTYDFDSSAWGNTLANHHSNLYPNTYTKYSVDASVKAYLDRGVPPEKIYIGAAFYSRGFANTDGLGKPSSGVVSDKSWEAGVLDYKDLPVAGANEMWDDVCKAGYSYDPVKRELNSYDTVRSIQEKCKYIKEHGLKGIIVWVIDADVPISNQRSLVKAIYDNLLVDNPEEETSPDEPAPEPEEPSPEEETSPDEPTPEPEEPSPDEHSPEEETSPDEPTPETEEPSPDKPISDNLPVPPEPCNCVPSQHGKIKRITHNSTLTTQPNGSWIKYTEVNYEYYE